MPVRYGAVELLEREAKCREIAFLDRAIVVGFEGLADDGIDFTLHVAQLVGGLAVARQRRKRQHAVPQYDALGLFIPSQVAAEPGAGGSKT